MKKILVFCLILGLLFLIGCGEEKVEDKKGGGSFILGEEKVKGETYTIIIEDNKFVSDDLEIKAGDTVEWMNKDKQEHTVTFENGDFNERLVGGATTSYTFREVGEFRYFCMIHPGMQGSVMVTKNT